MWLPDQQWIAHNEIYGEGDGDTSDDKDDLLVFGSGQAYMASNSNNNDSFFYSEEWLLDSGATVHITNDKDGMTYLRTSDHHVTIGDGSKVVGKLHGCLVLSTEDGHHLQLKNVLSSQVSIAAWPD